MVARLHFSSGPLSGQSLELSAGSYRVGRYQDNDICVPDPSLSGNHARLDISAIGAVVQDLESTNGSFLNGERFIQESLPRKCELRLGAVVIQIELPEVTISVPDLTPAPPPPPNLFEDGTQACRNHPEVLATLLCSKCGEAWCSGCVRQVGLSGGRNLLTFCASCDGKCSPLSQPRPRPAASLMGKLKGAFGLGGKRPG